MKVISIKKKTIIKIVAVIVFILIVGALSTSFGMQHYYKLDFSTGLVTASKLNVRSGPGTGYKIVATVNKMVNNIYFSHNSPTYGTPFEMLNSFKVSYKSAGENIAGNSSNSGAVNAWMNSSGHKANILSTNFNYTGIGVVSSSKYGKIYVQMFIGK